MATKRKYDEVEQDPAEVTTGNQHKIPKAEESEPQPDDQSDNTFSSYTPALNSAPPPLNPELEDCPDLLALPRGKWVSYVHETLDAKGNVAYKPMLLQFDPSNLVIDDYLNPVQNLKSCEAKVQYRVVVPELKVDKLVPFDLQTPSLSAPFGLSTAFNKDKNDTKSAVNLDLSLSGNDPKSDVVSFKLTLFDIDQAVSAKVAQNLKVWWSHKPKLSADIAKDYYGRLTRNRVSKPPKLEPGKPRPAQPFVPQIYPPRLTTKVFKKGPNAAILFDASDKQIQPSTSTITAGARVTARIRLPNLWVGDTEVNWSTRFTQGSVDQPGQQAAQNLLVKPSKN
jgi:hypothetical protein